MSNAAIRRSDILLPAEGIDLHLWSCVACDQYTSQPEYWETVRRDVGSAPSTLKLMLPECWLDQTEQMVPAINRTMQEYTANGSLVTAVRDGMILIERTVAAGRRLGLVCAVDLEDYCFDLGAKSLVRPTEQTIRSRLPARQAIRRGATLELPHIMMLTDDPMRTVIEPLYAARDTLRPLYDFDLMMDGGHLRGWAVEGDAAVQVLAALEALKLSKGEDPLLFAVGDGNHSLATAKVCWDELKETLSEAERESHPARYALVEVENIHDDALNFEPIHRILKDVDAPALFADFHKYCAAHGMQLVDNEGEQTFSTLWEGRICAYSFRNPTGSMVVETLQAFLDQWLAAHPEASIDYIHGMDAMEQLCAQPNTIGFLLPALDKSQFFSILDTIGVMPRKTFSLGEAQEKRFYMECRSLIEG